MSRNEVQTRVTEQAFVRLEQYISLLGKWRKVTNLISDASFADIWQRHIVDAIFLQNQQPQAKLWLDIGSGAGLPAVVLAILLSEAPGAQIHCVEIDRRKCTFLREVAVKLGLPMKIHNALIENVDVSVAPHLEIVTARAFSSIERILHITEPFMAKGAIVLLPRGRQSADEVAQLSHDSYRVKVTPNPTSGDGVFVQIELRAAHSQ